MIISIFDQNQFGGVCYEKKNGDSVFCHIWTKKKVSMATEWRLKNSIFAYFGCHGYPKKNIFW